MAWGRASSSCEEEFADAMRGWGLKPPSIIADGEIHRYREPEERNANSAYLLRQFPDGGAWGWFANWKTGIYERWHNKPARNAAPHERKLWQDRQRYEAKKADAARKERARQAAERASAIWERASPAPDTHPYLVKKGIPALDARIYKGLLVIPYRDASGAIHLLQYITSDGEKRFTKHGVKRGHFATIGVPGPEAVICEGWATGASLHLAGCPWVIVAGDCHSLLPVAQALGKKHPGIRLVFAADNDPVGASHADEAARITGGRAVLPPHGEDGPTTIKDFNDLHQAHGLDAVRAVLDAPPEEEAPPEPEKKPLAAPFKVLGFDQGSYYYYPKGSTQIVRLSAAQHTMVNLLALAPQDYWEGKYTRPQTSPTETALIAADDLFRQAERRGVFNPSISIRGRGGWLDRGKGIFNTGKEIWAGGKTYPLFGFKSDHAYIRATETPTPGSPLSGEEARKLHLITKMLNWEHQLAASLLAGWCVVSPVCAVLPWRPHIWLEGQKGSGKTTVMTEIIGRVLNGLCLHVSGGTTEAGLRQNIGYDGWPILFDEAESEEERQHQQMDGILQYARKASAGGDIIKGSQDGKRAMRYPCRAAICFAGINPGIKHIADESRISRLKINRATGPDAEARYAELKRSIAMWLTPEFSRRLLGRTLKYLPVLLKNIDTIASVAAQVLGDRRGADQIAPMIAGYALLYNDGELTEEWARKFIQANDWTPFTTIQEPEENERLLAYICSRSIRVERAGAGAAMITIGEAIAAVLKGLDSYSQAVHEGRELRTYGIWPRKDGVLFADKSDRLKDLLKNTPWRAGCKAHLLTFPGAREVQPLRFTPGTGTQRSVCLPVDFFNQE